MEVPRKDKRARGGRAEPRGSLIDPSYWAGFTIKKVFLITKNGKGMAQSAADSVLISTKNKS